MTAMLPDDIAEDRIVVDTDVFSYIFHRNPVAEFFQPYFMQRTLAVSFMTVAEVYYGALKGGWGTARISRLENQLKNYVVLPYDYEVTRQWAFVRTENERKGNDIQHADAWHAAVALHYEAALATNNYRHFKDTPGLTVISPSMQIGA